MFSNTTYRLNHPMTDRISIIDHEHAYATKGVSSECAFFMGKDWVTTPIPELAEYHDGTPADWDTCVYPHVPNDVLAAFLDKYRV